MHQDSGERSSDSIRDWAILAYDCPRVSGRDVGWLWPDRGSWALNTTVLGAVVHAGIIPFEGGLHYCHNPHYSLASGQTIWREHSHTYQQKIGLKIYWAWPCPSEQDPASPTVSPSQKKASTCLLSLSLEGRQNENHNHRKLTKLITWNTVLSNSVKLWAKSYRATQDGQVMMESSDKHGLVEKGMENHSVFLPWEPHEQYEKAKKVWHWKMNSQICRCRNSK